MLTIAGGIVLGFLGIVLISTPGFLAGLFTTARVLIGIAFLGGAVVALIAAREAQDGGTVVIAIGLGAIGLALLRSPSAPPTAASRAPRPEAAPPSPPREPFDADRAADELLRRTPRAVVARDRLVDIGITVAISAVVGRRTFEAIFERLLSVSDEGGDALITRTIDMLFAVDTMRTKTWAEAQRAMTARGAELEGDIAAWRRKRLDQFVGDRMDDFLRLASKPAFRSFAPQVMAWTHGERPLGLDPLPRRV